MCHGAAGNILALIQWYKVSRDKRYLHTALQLTKDQIINWKQLTSAGLMRTPDHPMSLFEGLAGALVICSQLLLQLRDLDNHQ